MFEWIVIPPYDENPKNKNNMPDSSFYEAETVYKKENNIGIISYSYRDYIINVNFKEVQYYKHFSDFEFPDRNKFWFSDVKFFRKIEDFISGRLGLIEIKEYALTPEVKEVFKITDLDDDTYYSNRHFEFYTEVSGLHFIICKDYEIEKIAKE